jgi:peptidoglycan/xylan/chitin deacetylase (PgdA/CDA1 family)
MLRFLIAAAVALFPAAASARCGADALGTARTLHLKRGAAAYGAAQHAPLPLRKGEVVLTFDDGPRPESTPLVLKALADQCVKATFFMNGEPMARRPDLARSVSAAGHSVGMHGFRHAHFPQLPEAAQLADLRGMQQAYRTVFGEAAPAYRFPFLEETPALRGALKAGKVTTMSVDLPIDDWLPAQTPEALTARMLERLRKSGGGIILMHDAQDQTALALPMLLKALKAEGYAVVHLTWRRR